MARIYQSPIMAGADIRVAIVADRSEADLLVYRVTGWGMASSDARWYITRERQDATTVICVTSRGMAQLQVCFVDNVDEAGWVRTHALRGSIR